MSATNIIRFEQIKAHCKCSFMQAKACHSPRVAPLDPLKYHNPHTLGFDLNVMGYIPFNIPAEVY